MTPERTRGLDRLAEKFSREPFSAGDAEARAGLAEPQIRDLLDQLVVERIGPDLYRVADAGHG